MPKNIKATQAKTQEVGMLLSSIVKVNTHVDIQFSHLTY